jgi:hypothetical protein
VSVGMDAMVSRIDIVALHDNTCRDDDAEHDGLGIQLDALQQRHVLLLLLGGSRMFNHILVQLLGAQVVIGMNMGVVVVVSVGMDAMVSRIDRLADPALVNAAALLGLLRHVDGEWWMVGVGECWVGGEAALRQQLQLECVAHV